MMSQVPRISALFLACALAACSGVPSPGWRDSLDGLHTDRASAAPLNAPVPRPGRSSVVAVTPSANMELLLRHGQDVAKALGEAQQNAALHVRDQDPQYLLNGAMAALGERLGPRVVLSDNLNQAPEAALRVVVDIRRDYGWSAGDTHRAAITLIFLDRDRRMVSRVEVEGTASVPSPPVPMFREAADGALASLREQLGKIIIQGSPSAMRNGREQGAGS